MEGLFSVRRAATHRDGAVAAAEAATVDDDDDASSLESKKEKDSFLVVDFGGTVAHLGLELGPEKDQMMLSLHRCRIQWS